jgi:hypothetical protein
VSRGDIEKDSANVAPERQVMVADMANPTIEAIRHELAGQILDGEDAIRRTAFRMRVAPTAIREAMKPE